MLPINSFGLLLSLGILVASFLVWKQARVRGISEEGIFDLFLLGIFFTLLGARIGFVFEHWAFFTVDPSKILFLFRYPGLSLHWGLVSGLGAIFIFSKSLELSALLVLDIFALAFSWTVAIASYGMSWYPLYFLSLAAVLFFLNQRIEKNGELSVYTRSSGFYFSCYLIFFSLCLLMYSKVYVAVLVLGSTFFLVRYHKIFKMAKVKFPANVLTQIRGYLEDKYKETEKRLRDLKKEDPFEDKSRLLDRASDDSEAQNKAGHERVTAIQQQLNMILVQTRKALTKIRIGNYGTCESCGKMIDTDRLAAMPTATLCLACERKREK